MIMKKNTKIICLILFLLTISFAIVALSLGRYSKIDITDIPSILFRYFSQNQITDTNTNVVMNLRFPRVVAAVFIGASLAIAGAAFQALFSNPIASPDTLGITHGTSFGAIVAILFGFNSLCMKFSAFFVGCLSVVLVYFISSRLSKGNNFTLFLLLTGMMITSIFQALISLVKYIADPDNQLPQITYWLMGSFSKVSNEDLPPLIILFFLASLPLFLLRWRLNFLTIPKEEAESMGINITTLQIITVLCATLLTTISTTLTGGIAWFALLIPHTVRLITGNDFRRIIPVSAFWGAFVLLIMDTLARTISIQELPISIITSIIGAPVFLITLIIRKRSIK